MTEPVRMTGTPRLDDLISGVEQAHVDPLDRVAGAAIVADALDETGDHLVGHFVDRARRAGASWTDIGRSMGVTKQAVQKRFVPKEAPPQDFRRFTPRARNAVVSAQNEARTAGNAEIRPEHLILGLLAEPDGPRRSSTRDSGRHGGGAPAGGDGGAAPARRRGARADPVRRCGKEGARAHVPRGAAAGTRFRRDRTHPARAAGTEGGTGVLAGLGVGKRRSSRRSPPTWPMSTRAEVARQETEFTTAADSIVARCAPGTISNRAPGMPAASVRACGSTGVAASSAPATTSVGAVIAGSRSRWSQTASAAQQPM